MSLTISFGGGWDDQRTYDAPDGSGQLFRRGFTISWSKSLDPKIVFSLHVQIRLQGMEIEQDFKIRETR